MESKFEYKLVRSKRKSLGIKIDRDARVIVMAPNNMKISDIEAFLEKKSNWINKNLSKMQQCKQIRDSFSIDENSKLLFLGREYPFVRSEDEQAGFDAGYFHVPMDTPQDEVIAMVKGIYKQLAESLLVKRTYDLAERFGESLNNVKISSASTRWGSCSSKRNINLSFYLVMASPSAVDYCIIHELCHLKHMNHSKSFWSLVQMRDPKYIEHETELKRLSQKLALENF